MSSLVLSILYDSIFFPLNISISLLLKCFSVFPGVFNMHFCLVGAHTQKYYVVL